MNTRIKRNFVSLIKRIRNLVVPVLLYETPAGRSEKLTFLFIGWDRRLRSYWLQRLFGADFIRIQRMFLPVRQIGKDWLRNYSNADLAIIESWLPIENMKKRPAFLVPGWMEFEIRIEDALTKKRTKEISRRIKKYSIGYELRNRKSDLDFFYHRMYRPLLRINHGDAAEPAKKDYFHSKFKQGVLEMMFLKSDGKVVAASLLEKGQEWNRILAFGVLDGSREVLRIGIHAAAYYFTMLRLKEEGHGRMLCGSSMPVALDGVTQFKLRLGARPHRKDLSARKKYRVILVKDSPHLMQVMKSNPIYYVSGDNLRIATFLNAEDFSDPESVNQFLKLLGAEYPGMIDCYVRHNRKIMEKWIEEGEIPPVDLKEYETAGI